MMRSFTIKDGAGSQLHFETPIFGPDAFVESYDVTLETPYLKMRQNIYRDYGRGYNGEGDFFTKLADSWRGWWGEISFENIEGQMSLVATSDSTGHVYLRVRLRNWSSYETSASAHLVIDAGQLDSIAADVRRFFAMR